MTRIVLSIAAFFFATSTCSTTCQAQNVARLWAGAAPGALGESDKDTPKLATYLASGQSNTGAAVVICPGGGYGNLAMGHEGEDVARWLNRHGVSGFVCDYRHRGKGYGHPAPLLDVQRAIRTVRHHAESAKGGCEIDSDKIGVIGFSAGGHLASCAATMFDSGQANAKDPIEQMSSRPDFAILCYPVIAFGQSFTHQGSQNNLLGKAATPEQIRSMSTQTRVTSDTPPTFLWHTSTDKAVPPQNSIVFYQSLLSAGVTSELHFYATGRHGLGLARGKGGVERLKVIDEPATEHRDD